MLSSREGEKPAITAWVIYEHDGARRVQQDVLRLNPIAQTTVSGFATPEEALESLESTSGSLPDVIFMQDVSALEFFNRAQAIANNKKGTSIQEVIVTPLDVTVVQDALLVQDPQRTNTIVVSVLNPQGLQTAIGKVVKQKSEMIDAA